MRLHEAPNRATARKEAPQTELSCTPIPPTQFVGYILRSPSYIISVRVSVSVRLGEISKPRLVQVSIVFKGSLGSLADYLSRRCAIRSSFQVGHSQTAEAASFRRALFTPGANESLGPPHALAAPMRLRNRPSRTIGANFVFMAPASVAWLAGY